MLELRRFEETDLEQVWELHNRGLRDVGVHLGPGPWDDDMRSIKASYLDDGGEFLVGTVEGRLAAIGALRHVTGSVAEIKRMRVHPRFQRRGFGRIVLEALERHARERGYRKITLDTGVIQVAAQRFYESAGYEQVGRGQIAGIDVIYYEKRLS